MTPDERALLTRIRDRIAATRAVDSTSAESFRTMLEVVWAELDVLVRQPDEDDDEDWDGDGMMMSPEEFHAALAERNRRRTEWARFAASLPEVPTIDTTKMAKLGYRAMFGPFEEEDR